MCDAEQVKNTREVFKNIFALYVGQGRRYSVETISDATGISAATLNKYRRGESCPEWPQAVAIMGALGPAFASAILAPAGLGGVRKVEEETTDAGHMLSRMLDEGAALARAWEDRRIDHREAADLEKRFEKIGVECIGFARTVHLQVK
jgi:hypothetical protein